MRRRRRMKISPVSFVYSINSLIISLGFLFICLGWRDTDLWCLFFVAKYEHGVFL
uniref:Uncharacterized protein n=1 Tax=Anguilla anguilla TaxID=7936 RepID=A0A0E9Y0F9_ANGAN